MPSLLDPVTVTIRGKHDSGKTTLASLFKMFLEENGYKHIELVDVEPLPQELKDRFINRFMRNRQIRPVKIRVELEE